jgi:hypothetical protein
MCVANLPSDVISLWDGDLELGRKIPFGKFENSVVVPAAGSDLPA